MAEVTSDLIYEVLKKSSAAGLPISNWSSIEHCAVLSMPFEVTCHRYRPTSNNIYSVMPRIDERLDRIERRLDLREFAEPQRPFDPHMKSAVVLLPGLNRDRDMIAALTKISGKPPVTVWQTDTEIPDVDLIAIPGGFSYGDYLRCGAIAARKPVMRAVAEKAAKGVMVIGVCNGFQILLEAGLLPGALMRNTSLKFVCREVKLSVANANTAFTRDYAPGQIIRAPVAHHDGNYFADAETHGAARGRWPGRVPLCRGHQSQRLDERHRRHHERARATCSA